MVTAELKQRDTHPQIIENESLADLSADPRWQLIERISQSGPFQKSNRLPALLRYLARCAITNDCHGLSEQVIGREVFGKPKNYTPAEDSSVRVYVRQLRLRLHEYYQAPDRHEDLLVSLPKGGYVLTFSPLATPTVEGGEVAEKPDAPSSNRHLFQVSISILLLAIATFCAIGWYRAAKTSQYKTPWPLNQVIGESSQTTLVLADTAYSLRMLGNQEVPLDRYVDRSFLESIIPKQMTEGEGRLIHYLEVSRITSVADARAAAVISVLAGPYTQNLVIRSAKDLNPNDLMRGNFIFVGAKSSNPWVELFDNRLNFQFVENGPGGTRYILNTKPKRGEMTKYSVPDNTGASGEDYATITLLPARNGSGNILLIQGLRMEGTEAAINLLKTESLRQKLQQKLQAANGNQTPLYFEVLLHAQSVAGAPVSMDVVAVRPGT
jgi:hypothetical protein